MYQEDEQKKLPTSRREARETALQLLYAAELTDYTPAEVIQQNFDIECDENPACTFAKSIIQHTHEGREEYDEYIREHSSNWRFERIAIIDRIILRMAICEFLHFFDIPPKVSIDEAIEMSKRFSTEKSSGFINGILDAVYDDLKKKHQLVKTGRGTKDKKKQSK